MLVDGLTGERGERFGFPLEPAMPRLPRLSNDVSVDELAEIRVYVEQQRAGSRVLSKEEAHGRKVITAPRGRPARGGARK